MVGRVPDDAGSDHRRGPAVAPSAESRPIWELAPEQERDLMAQALARVQEAQPTWPEGWPDLPAGS
jgi:hypothetical protein